MDWKTEGVSQAVQTTPPLTVTSLLIFGYPVEWWIQGLTVFYLVAQLLYLGWKWYKDVKKK